MKSWTVAVLFNYHYTTLEFINDFDDFDYTVNQQLRKLVMDITLPIFPGLFGFAGEREAILLWQKSTVTFKDIPVHAKFNDLQYFPVVSNENFFPFQSVFVALRSV